MRIGTWMMTSALAAVLLVPGAGRAQLAWDSPMLLPPRAPDGLGLYLMDVHGGELGVMGTWREPTLGFGIRAGLAEGRGNDIGIFGGIDFTGSLTGGSGSGGASVSGASASGDFPLAIDWLFGAGLGMGDGVRLSLPVGLTAGHTFEGDGVYFTPYVTPRVILDAFLGADDRRDSEDLDLDVAIDIGLDLRFRSDFTVRFGATVGDRNAVAIGVAF